ncbi:MAG TPA: hypothetical protein VIF61_04180, partial [Methylocystis sp.]
IVYSQDDAFVKAPKSSAGIWAKAQFLRVSPKKNPFTSNTSIPTPRRDAFQAPATHPLLAESQPLFARDGLRLAALSYKTAQTLGSAPNRDRLVSIGGFLVAHG